ncbi:hypothetical protein A2V68_00150 [candidate division Kazan bacterium RBG_13_50_9]|uniref:NAD-dependent epimerase/dehydratase domain-containing protein n=1 Tax=candidate division Kazan bacterium RBG_13_50_9 TaxID=1798535 RepID=A0A1F4NRR7_UNCK3|nr:MAG: hypothetical protein A2V68_00150 [candidate division Kazan bacterium RBG_13_50_9]
MKVLVTGGSGYIGGAVTDALFQRGIDFTVYDNLLYEQQYLKPVDFIQGDIRDREKLGKILPNFTHVIWLVAIVGDGACQIDPPTTVAVNQDAVRWLSENFDGRIIFLSTCSVYGQSDEWLDESSEVKPLSLYAQTKLQAEKYLGNKNSIIFRLGTAYGLADVHARIRLDLAVNYMTMNAIKKGGLTVFGGEQWRPFIHVKDIARCVAESLDKDWTGIYNLATSNLQISELARMIAEETGCQVTYAEREFADPRNYHVHTDKARNIGLLKSTTPYDVPFGIGEITRLVRSGRIKDVDQSVYSNERHLSAQAQNGGFK